MGDPQNVSDAYKKNMEQTAENKRLRDTVSIFFILFGSVITAVNLNTFVELTNQSSTLLKGFGFYSANKKSLLYTILSDSDVKKMKKSIREQYPDTFVNVINSSDVMENFYIQPLE